MDGHSSIDLRLPTTLWKFVGNWFHIACLSQVILGLIDLVWLVRTTILEGSNRWTLNLVCVNIFSWIFAHETYVILFIHTVRKRYNYRIFKIRTILLKRILRKSLNLTEILLLVYSPTYKICDWHIHIYIHCSD